MASRGLLDVLQEKPIVHRPSVTGGARYPNRALARRALARRALSRNVRQLVHEAVLEGVAARVAAAAVQEDAEDVRLAALRLHVAAQRHDARDVARLGPDLPVRRVALQPVAQRAVGHPGDRERRLELVEVLPARRERRSGSPRTRPRRRGSYARGRTRPRAGSATASSPSDERNAATSARPFSHVPLPRFSAPSVFRICSAKKDCERLLQTASAERIGVSCVWRSTRPENGGAAPTALPSSPSAARRRGCRPRAGPARAPPRNRAAGRARSRRRPTSGSGRRGPRPRPCGCRPRGARRPRCSGEAVTTFEMRFRRGGPSGSKPRSAGLPGRRPPEARTRTMLSL